MDRLPREGNNWSYKYCRRQWSLVDNPELKYQYLASFDQKMIKVVKENEIMKSMFAQQLNMDENNKTIIFERNNLIFIFNFHPFVSVPGYEFRVPQPGSYKIILNSDRKEFGGHNRIDESLVYESYQHENNPDHFLRIYVPNRTAIILKKIVQA
jgi:1,4-alpha-glucan branching enzyme